MKNNLSEEQISTYQEDGYLIINEVNPLIYSGK